MDGVRLRMHQRILLMYRFASLLIASSNLCAAAVTGKAYFTVERYPLPDASWKPWAIGTNLAYGPQIIERRLDFEKAMNISSAEVLGILTNTALRLVNYTDYPSQTPGLHNFSSRAYTWVSYAPYVPAYQYVIGTGSYFTNQVASAQQPAWHRYLEQYGHNISADLIVTSVHLVNTPLNDGKTLPAEAKPSDCADVVSTLQISGRNMVPFSYDKQAVFLTQLFRANSLDGLPMAWANFPEAAAVVAAKDISSSRHVNGRRLFAADSARHSSGVHRRLTSSWTAKTFSASSSDRFRQTISADVFTHLLPVPNMTVAQLWTRLAPRLSSLTAAAGLQMDVVFSNATVTTLVRGRSRPIVTQDFYSASTSKNALSSRGTNSSGSLNLSSAPSSQLTGGAIAGISIASILLVLLAAAAAAYTWVRRRRRLDAISRSSPSEESSGIKKANSWLKQWSSFSDTTSGSYEEISEDEIALDRRPDGTLVLLGAGAYGSVYAGTWRSCPVAVKQLNEATDSHAIADLHKEVDILKRVSKNRNVVQFFGISRNRIVTELMEGGNLRQALRHNHDAYAWEHRGQVVALDIARGLSFLHSSGVIHRDIKASNVLLTKEGVAKIADVGLATTANLFTAGTTQGTWAYAAPELLVASMAVRCSCAVDIFSFGVLLWEIVTRETPVRGGMRLVTPEECPPQVHHLLDTCITENIEERPTAATVVKVLEALNDTSIPSS